MRFQDKSRNPEVSVVVASFSGEAALVRCLSSLFPQAADAEVIVATNAPTEVVARVATHFPAVHFIQGPEDASVFRLRTLGVAQARGNIIALLEDHCTVSPQWLDAFCAACRGGHPIVGGPVENGLCHRIYDWALYLCEYGAFMPPLPEGPAPILSGINVAYSRQALWSCRPTWEDTFHENEVHDALRAAGHRLHLAVGAGVRSHLGMSFTEAMAHLFTGGRHFGRYRRSQSSTARRWLWVAATPSVPFVLIGRIFRAVAARQPKRLGVLLCGLPYVCGLLGAWSLGEAMGYLTHRTTGSRVQQQPQGV
jgi:glycosyltransferase involved in cell wall biosynthesis